MITKHCLFSAVVVLLILAFLSGCVQQPQGSEFTIHSIEISDVRTKASLEEINDRADACREVKETGYSEKWGSVEHACSAFGYQADIIVTLDDYEDMGWTPLNCVFKIDDEMVHRHGLENGLNDDVYLIGHSIYFRGDEPHSLEICCTPSWNTDYSKELGDEVRALDTSFTKCVTTPIDKVW